MSGQTENKSTLARIAVVIGILGTIATITSIAWTILHKENNEVRDYQSKVAATCEQIHNVLATEHNEIFVVGTQSDADSPDDLVRVPKISCCA